MEKGWERNYRECELGDRRLARRAGSIGQAISEQYGQGLSSIFGNANNLKRAYDFSAIKRQVLVKLLPLIVI